jgi:hypothetical protein
MLRVSPQSSESEYIYTGWPIQNSRKSKTYYKFPKGFFSVPWGSLAQSLLWENMPCWQPVAIFRHLLNVLQKNKGHCWVWKKETFTVPLVEHFCQVVCAWSVHKQNIYKQALHVINNCQNAPSIATYESCRMASWRKRLTSETLTPPSLLPNGSHESCFLVYTCCMACDFQARSDVTM